MQKEELALGTHIIDNYYMSADSNQYILTRLVTRTSRKDQSQYDAVETLGYFGTVQSLCKHIIKDHIRHNITSGNLPTLRTVIDDLNNITSRLESSISF